MHCFRQAGWLDLLRQSGGAIGDLGYEGEPDVGHTPIKKRPHIDLGGVEHDLNRSLARVRVGVEWGVGHLTNWRILTTRYRSDLSRIDTDIQATAGLRSSTNSSPNSPSPTRGSKQHSQISEQLQCVAVA